MINKLYFFKFVIEKSLIINHYKLTYFEIVTNYCINRTLLLKSIKRMLLLLLLITLIYIMVKNYKF